MARLKHNWSDLYELIGSRIKFYDRKACYEGVIVKVDSQLGHISLVDVEDVINQRSIKGLQVFTLADVENCQVVERNVLVEPPRKNNRVIKIAKSRSFVVLKDEDFDDDGEVDWSSALHDGQDNTKVLNIDVDEAAKYINLVPRYCRRSDTTPICSILIETIDDDFHSAISDIEENDTIGLSLNNIYDDKSVSWLTVSTSTKVYLFDILQLDQDAFKHGLKEILESENVLKIMHESRMGFSALRNIFGVNLKPLEDTKVSSAFSFKERYGKLPQGLISLNQCLRKVLGINPQQLNLDQLSDEELSIRPLTGATRLYLVKDVLYLIDLQHTFRLRREPRFSFENEQFCNSFLGCKTNKEYIEEGYEDPGIIPNYLHHWMEYNKTIIE